MIISNYEILEKIAEAPQAAVYKAFHKKNRDRLLILKILKADTLSDYKKAQFRQKIEHLRVMNDPLVITPISFGEKEGVCFITQDYFEGVTLDNLMASHARISLNDFFTIACKLARALEYVHEAGIIHGGIKPHNILVDARTLDIRLIDFFSAVDVRDVSHFIYDRSFVRDTLAYTSPEQTGRINHRVVFSSDLYSLGNRVLRDADRPPAFLLRRSPGIDPCPPGQGSAEGPRIKPQHSRGPQQDRRQIDAQVAGKALPEQRRSPGGPHPVPGRILRHRHHP